MSLGIALLEQFFFFKSIWGRIQTKMSFLISADAQGFLTLKSRLPVATNFPNKNSKCKAHLSANVLYFYTVFRPQILNYLTVLVNLQNTFKRHMSFIPSSFLSVRNSKTQVLIPQDSWVIAKLGIQNPELNQPKKNETIFFKQRSKHLLYIRKSVLSAFLAYAHLMVQFSNKDTEIHRGCHFPKAIYPENSRT